jgi:hypothetical protein
MFKLERLRAPIYITFITSIVPIRSDGVELNAIDTKEVRLLTKYKAYTDLFLEVEAVKFPNNTRIEHFILIKESVEVLYSLIYSLSTNELQVLREYIKSSLEKGWIRHSKSPISALILFILKKDNGLRLNIDN